MKSILSGLLIILLCSFGLKSSLIDVNTDDIKATWWNAEKDAKIKIFLAQNGKYAGKIVWMKEPNDEKGNPKVDNKNPNTKKRSNPRLGLAIMMNFSFNEKSKRWEDGTIYDPKNGKTYDGYMYFEDGNKTKLNLRGYVMGVSALGRTSVWERAED